MTLDIYFARRFLRAFLLVFGAFFGFLLLLEIVEQIRRFDMSDLGLAAAMELALLSAPETLYRILPLMTLLSGLVLCLGLSRTSELVIARGSGRSGLKSLFGPAVAVLVIGGLGVAVFNPIVAATSLQYEAASSRFAGGGERAFSVSSEGLWLRQGSSEGQTVVRAARASGDGTRLFEMTFITFDPAGVPVRRIAAAEGQLSPGKWLLRGVKDWPLEGTDNPERDARLMASLELPTDLTVESIRDSFGTPSVVPIWKLPAFIAQLEAAGFAARQHRVWLQMELAQPLFLLSMLLIGAGFTMRHARLGRNGRMVMLALLTGFGLYLMRNFAQVLGESGQIPVALAAWSPPVAGLLAALGLLLHVEDG